MYWIVAAGLGLSALAAHAEVKPFLSVVPRFCGVNILEGTSPRFVNQVCLSGVAGTSQQVLHVTYTDGGELALPIVASKREGRAVVHYAATGTVARAADGGPVRLGTVRATQRGMSLSGTLPRGLSFEATLAPVRVTAGVR
jgi:hypothetical protein